MNKAELAAEFAKSLNLTKTEAARFLDTFIDVVIGQLKEGKSIAVSGLGTLSVQERSQRTARHPQTGETIHIPAKKVVKFKASSVLNDAVQSEETV